MTPDQLADRILRAAGSGLRHYTTRTKDEILAAAASALEKIRGEKK